MSHHSAVVAGLWLNSARLLASADSEPEPRQHYFSPLRKFTGILSSASLSENSHMKRSKHIAKHDHNVSRCALRSSTAGSIGVGTGDGRREGKKGCNMMQHGRHGLFLNVQIWYRSVFAFLTGQSLKMGILSNALIIKTCQNSIVIVFMLIQTQLYWSLYRGFFACLINLIQGSVTGLILNLVPALHVEHFGLMLQAVKLKLTLSSAKGTKLVSLGGAEGFVDQVNCVRKGTVGNVVCRVIRSCSR